MTDNIIHLEDLRLTRKARAPYQPEGCAHLHLTMHAHGETISCDDCHLQVSAWWVLNNFGNQMRDACARLQREQQALAAREQKAVTLKAAQDVESAWRSRTMVPACPHCGEAIFSGDGFGRSQINRELAERRRALLAAARKTLRTREADYAG